MPIAPVEEFGPANQENEEGVKRRSNQGQEKIKEEIRRKKNDNGIIEKRTHVISP